LHSSASVEWYTPEWVAELARRVMGSIDLDPASCDVAQRTIKALEYYTREDDGLAKPWVGNVFCNPPYGRTVDPDGGATRSSCAVWTRVGPPHASSGSGDHGLWVVALRPRGGGRSRWRGAGAGGACSGPVAEQARSAPRTLTRVSGGGAAPAVTSAGHTK